MTKLALLLCLVGCSVDDNTTPSCVSSSSDVCTGDNICLGETCGAAFPHAYTITAISVTAPPTKPNGDPWDTNNQDGSPNIYVDITVGGAVVATTPVIMTSYNATFAGPFTVMLNSGDALDLNASSMAGGTKDEVNDCSIPTVSAAILRVRYVLCSGTGTQMNYSIDPM